MVTAVSQAVFKQLRLRIEVDTMWYPGKKKLKIKGKELECLPAEVFLLNEHIEILDLSPEREACLFYHLDEVRQPLHVAQENTRAELSKSLFQIQPARRKN